jgi:hypothetical protein
MKKTILLMLLASTSAFAGNSQIGSSETQGVCGDSTYEMQACSMGKAHDSELKIKANIQAKKSSVKERMQEEEMSAEDIKNMISRLNKVPVQIQEATLAYCAAEGAEETSVGSLGGVVVASCLSEKLQALSEVFK